jgi:hypothetical protein
MDARHEAASSGVAADCIVVSQTVKGRRWVVKYLILFSSVAAVILVLAAATLAQADECDKTTYFTFSAPVALPGVTLPAGTYRFSHPDCDETEHILRVASRDGLQVYGTFLAIPDERVTASRKPLVILGERPAGAPEAVKAWFYPGETIGDELIYSKTIGQVTGPA